MSYPTLTLALTLAFGTASALPATAAVPGASPGALYGEYCAACHEGGVPRAPHSVKFQILGPEAIYAAMTVGVMKEQAAPLDDSQRRALAEHLGGRTLTLGTAAPTPPACTGDNAKFDLDRPPTLAGWGMTTANTRHVSQDVAGLAAQDVPTLRLKWAFAFHGASRARSQPTLAGGAVFVGSQAGTVYALDLATGCVRWSFQADAEVRSAPAIESWRPGDEEARPRLFFGDLNGAVYGLEALTGQLLWKVAANDHPRTTITGSPRVFEGRVYVPLSSTEWASAADPAYECCTFRGGVTALNAADGSLLWRSYTITEEPALTGTRNSAGALRRGPAGAPVWNSPTIDPGRRRLYVGTGEAYTSPAAKTSDAVIAFDLDTGKQLWHYQSIPGDAWNMACFIGGGPNCPEENGPDLDIGAPPILARLGDDQEVLLVGQKSAHVFALAPDDGRLLWRVKHGRGGFAGGVHWGMAYDGTTLYAPNADTIFLGTEQGEAKPGLFALNPADGSIRWFTPNPDICPEALKPACDPGLSPPPTSMPGVVFAGAFDGWLRAYDSASGKVIWAFDTVREFETVSGEIARGGSIESAGPVIAEGHVLVNSGYLFGGRMAGNVLLVFDVEKP
ncbi:MAG: PQQ-binding-like beta-propeller repeat protein [Steroidobacteraceae bacterium]